MPSRPTDIPELQSRDREGRTTMPDNTRMERCISEQRGALVFWAPDGDRGRLTSKAQIIDVFSLQVATGFVRDPRGWLLLQAQP